MNKNKNICTDGLSVLSKSSLFLHIYLHSYTQSERKRVEQSGANSKQPPLSNIRGEKKSKQKNKNKKKNPPTAQGTTPFLFLSSTIHSKEQLRPCSSQRANAPRRDLHTPIGRVPVTLLLHQLFHLLFHLRGLLTSSVSCVCFVRRNVLFSC